MSIIDTINSSVWCRLAPSAIHGVGVVAIRDIPKGTFLGTDKRNHLAKIPSTWVISDNHWRYIRPEILSLILDRTIISAQQTMFLNNPNFDADMRSFMNTSNDPNSDGTFALRDISEGEEITESYQVGVQVHPLSKEHLGRLII
jgi:hypothetical protein